MLIFSLNISNWFESLFYSRFSSPAFNIVCRWVFAAQGHSSHPKGLHTMLPYASQVRVAYLSRGLTRFSTAALVDSRACLHRHLRPFHTSQAQCGLQDLQPGGVPSPNPVPDLEEDVDDDDRSDRKRRSNNNGGGKGTPHWKETVHRMFEAGATAFASIAVLG